MTRKPVVYVSETPKILEGRVRRLRKALREVLADLNLPDAEDVELYECVLCGARDPQFHVGKCPGDTAFRALCKDEVR